jgi:hypothetical protein
LHSVWLLGRLASFCEHGVDKLLLGSVRVLLSLLLLGQLTLLLNSKALHLPVFELITHNLTALN